MNKSIYQDRYNTVKTWQVEQKGDVYHVSQFINEAKFGKSVKMTEQQIQEIGIFGFDLLSSVELKPQTKFVFSAENMDESKVILAIDYKDAQKKARNYLGVKRLPNNYTIVSLSNNLSKIMQADIQ